MQLSKKIFLSTVVFIAVISFGVSCAFASEGENPVLAVSTGVGTGNTNNGTGIGTGDTNTTGGVGTGNTNNGTGIGTGNTGGGTETIVNPLKGIKDLPSFLKVILGAMIQLGEVILVLAFVWIGFLFVKAQGAPAEIKKARDAFFWTIIGGLILLSANAILLVVQSTATSLSN